MLLHWQRKINGKAAQDWVASAAMRTGSMLTPRRCTSMASPTADKQAGRGRAGRGQLQVCRLIPGGVAEGFPRLCSGEVNSSFRNSDGSQLLRRREKGFAIGG